MERFCGGNMAREHVVEELLELGHGAHPRMPHGDSASNDAPQVVNSAFCLGKQLEDLARDVALEAPHDRTAATVASVAASYRAVVSQEN